MPPEFESTFSEYIASLDRPPSDDDSSKKLPESITAGVYYKFLAICKKHGIRTPSRPW